MAVRRAEQIPADSDIFSYAVASFFLSPPIASQRTKCFIVIIGIGMNGRNIYLFTLPALVIASYSYSRCM